MIKLGLRPLFEPKRKIFVVADVHAEYDKLKRLIKKIKPILKPIDHIVFVGDLIDAGPNNPDTLLLIQNLKKLHENTFVIHGNHEEMLLNAIKTDGKDWLDNYGLKKTLDQFKIFGIETLKELNIWLEKEKITVFNELIPYYETENVLITHAPVPEKVNDFLTVEEGILERIKDDLRWGFADREKVKIVEFGDKLLICGHQNNYGRTKAPRIYLEENRIFLDAGAGYHKDAPLACVVINPDKKIRIILSE